MPLPPVFNTPYCNTIGARRPAAVSGQSRRREPHRRRGALERARDGGARQPRPSGARRPHRHLCLDRRPVRGRLQPLLPRPATRQCAADLVYFQPHAAPGVYARAFLEGRLTSRRSSTTIGARPAATGCRPTAIRGSCPTSGSSRPARWASGRSARSTRRASCATSRTAASSTRADRKVWAFVGDGEMDEPESLAGLSLAAREGLDNLIFVVNCNLQRLDGPVRGNGSIIQELEGLFAGAGWNVIKLLWGSDWDPLFARDTEGVILQAPARNRRRRVPEVRRHRRALQPRAFLQQVPGAAGDRRASVRRRHRPPAPRRPRPGEDLRRLPRRRAAPRPARR